MSIRPVPAFEPPYYTVVFTSVMREDAEEFEEYGPTAERMAELVKEIPGFLGYESARGANGLGITVGYFKDEASIEAWRRDVEHQAAQRRGIKQWYGSYSLHVAKVERSHSFEHGA
ncbi:antibiotic biosynthesis monooxygenase family protein [Streptomyces sp. NPDC050504]|uniref:antibiotic biosynthesis monooxygenase family protein n=1 Tax=Streptomyces sp. NPDC050504 TaxID=3365618 RepID=UPI0037B47B34